MQFDDNHLSPGHIYILCPADLALLVYQELKRLSHQSWESLDRIWVYPVPPKYANDPKHVTSKINRIDYRVSERGGFLNVIAISPIRFNGSDLHSHVGQRHSALNPTEFRAILSKLLTALQLDNISLAASQLRAWEHAQISRSYIEQWVTQFETAGAERWVGESLLSTLEFWPVPSLFPETSFEAASLNGFDCIAINTHKIGSSAWRLANYFKKHSDSSTSNIMDVIDIHDAILHPDYDRILFFEDGIITGNEMIRIFGGLLGHDDRWGSRKVAALPDPSTLYDKDIQIRAGIATNFGLVALSDFLDTHSLHNIRIDVSDDRMIEVLTPQGIAALHESRLVNADDCILNPRKHLTQPAFRDLGIWRGKQERAKASKFCAEIGAQLYGQYRSQRKKAETSPEWTRQAGLGAKGLALALGYSHSIPKSSLPVFWAGGYVRYKNHHVEWIPLFPHGT